MHWFAADKFADKSYPLHGHVYIVMEPDSLD